MKEIHETYINQCIKLAQKAKGDTFPNPLVGCIILKNGKIIGKGFHRKYGSPHAEVEAIKNAKESVENATLYVNLEPCSHYGKTPPCADLIIEKKIKKVIIGMKDPNPLVAGRGIDKLKKAGIEVICGVLEEKCKKLNEVFIKNITEKKAFFNLKLAATLDGKIAEPNGFSKWITGEKSRKYVHELRYYCGAVLIGANTLKKDNPDLNARKNNKIIKETFKIIMTKNFNFSNHLKVFQNNNLNKIIFLTPETSNPPDFYLKNFTILKFKNFNEIPYILFNNKIYNILVEGGAEISYIFLKEKLIDKVYFFYSNKILGGNAISMIGGNESFSLKNPFSINIEKIKKFENDFLITGYPKYKKF